MTPEHSGRFFSILIAFLIGCGDAAVFALDPPAVCPPVPVAVPQAPFGYYPTQWRPFPGGWSELHPLAVPIPTTPEPEIPGKVLPPPVQEVPAPRKKLILPTESNNPRDPRDPGEPVSPAHPSTSPVVPKWPTLPRTVITGGLSGPALTPPEPLAGKDQRKLPESFLEAETSGKAWIDAPREVKQAEHVEAVRSRAIDPADPWRASPK